MPCSMDYTLKAAIDSMANESIDRTLSKKVKCWTSPMELILKGIGHASRPF